MMFAQATRSATAPLDDSQIGKFLSEIPKLPTKQVVRLSSNETAVIDENALPRIQTTFWRVHQGYKQANENTTVVVRASNASTSDDELFSSDAITNLVKLINCYLFPEDVDNLLALLRGNPKVMQVAVDAHAFLDRHFPASATPMLKVVSDLDSSEPNESLFIVLQTALDVENAIDRLRSLEDEWLTSEVDGKSLITFDVEFV
jgi:hypothetical protein